MKYITLIILFCFLRLLSIGQDSLPKQPAQPYFPTGFAEYGYIKSDYGFVNAIRDTLWQPKYKGTEVLWYHDGVDTAKWIYIGATSGPKWVKSGSGSSNNIGDSSIIIGGKPISHLPSLGENAPSNVSPDSMFNWLYYQSQEPLATLSGGTTLELTAASTVSQTLNWSASRQEATTPLSTIVVAGVSQTFSNPSAPGTVSGTQVVNVPANITITYTNTVTTTDGKLAVVTTTFNSLGKKYYGLISDTTGIATGSQDASILGLANSFANSKNLNVNTGSITGTKFWVYVYPANLGGASTLSFNGLPALESMNTVTRSFTNAQGYTQNYIYYWNKQGQTISSDIIVN